MTMDSDIRKTDEAANDEKIAEILTQKRIFVREEYCVGCRLCEIFCIASRTGYGSDVVKAFKKSAVIPMPGIIVEERKPLSFGLQCRHCDEPECVKACITGAMRKDPVTGAVTVDGERCIGCWTCILACPYGTVVMDHKLKKVASKCDMCVENGGNPVCVQNCPNGALYIADIEKPGNTVAGSTGAGSTVAGSTVAGSTVAESTGAGSAAPGSRAASRGLKRTSPGFVIIGNSTAGIAAAEGIRRIDNESQVTIISDEPHHTYSRPLISYYLGGIVPEDRIYYRDEDFYEKNAIMTILGVKASGLDTDAHDVILENGRRIPYSKLLIATGGKPFVPPMEGVSKKNVFKFIKYDDVGKISKVALRGKKAVVIGASFSGLKAVEALVHRGVEVTVVDIMDRFMPRIFDEIASSIAESVIAGRGVKICLGATVSRLAGEGDTVTAVELVDGRRLECDFVILAIGVRCNTDIVKDTGILTNRGIKVDAGMRTNLPDIYAAGDVAEGLNFIEEKEMEIAIIPNAYKQGETAGINMAGGDKVFEHGMMMNSMPIFGMNVMSAGISEERPGVEVKIIHRPEDLVYKKFYFREGCLEGFLLINEVDRAGLYIDLIRNRTDVTGFAGEIGESRFGFASMPKELRKERIADPQSLKAERSYARCLS